MSIVSPNGSKILNPVFDSNSNENQISVFGDLNNSSCRRKRSRSRRKSRRRSRSRCSMKRRKRRRSVKRRTCGIRKRRRKSRKRSCRSAKRRKVRRRSRSSCKKRGCTWRESNFAKIKQGKCCKKRLKYKLSPYALWVKQNMKSLKGKGDSSQIMRALAKSWKCLSPMDKAKFYHKAAANKKRKCK